MKKPLHPPHQRNWKVTPGVTINQHIFSPLPPKSNYELHYLTPPSFLKERFRDTQLHRLLTKQYNFLFHRHCNNSNKMSQKECPVCHYNIFMKKKDYIDHVTYSSCSESLQDFLVMCPHCKKHFSNNDSLSYYLMRNETCSRKQDKAFEILNWLPNTNNVITGGGHKNN
jgi:hypothetical protein